MSKKMKNHVAHYCAMYYPSLVKVCKSRWNTDPKDIMSPRIEVPFYICPFCLDSCIFINGNELDGDDFSKDHYPPKSVAGNETVLVCKACNSRYGHEFDYGIENTLQDYSFIKKQGEIKAKTSVEGIPGNYHSFLSWEDDKLVTKIDFKKYTFFNERFRSKAKTNSIEKMNFSFKVSDPTKLNLAYLKAAYLKCFKFFGYDFALSVNGRKIVEVLNGELKHPLENCGVFRDDHAAAKASKISGVKSPSRYRSIVCTFTSKIKTSKHLHKNFVVIPLNQTDCWSNLKLFEDVTPDKELLLMTIDLDDSVGIPAGRYFDYSKLTEEIFYQELDE